MEHINQVSRGQYNENYDTYHREIQQPYSMPQPLTTDDLLCRICGALVGEGTLHEEWHAAIGRLIKYLGDQATINGSMEILAEMKKI